MRCLLPLLFIAQNPGCPHVEMDSVIGRIGGKVLLTLIFPKTEFMLAFLRDNNTAASVADCFTTLYQGLGSEDFERLFPALLTDNGTEFSNPKTTATKRCYFLYSFCDIDSSDINEKQYIAERKI